jgi:DNA-binding MarR family transcriptional regulator
VPPEDERQIGFLISDVARLMRTAFDRRVRALGLTRSQWLVINRLHRRPGATQSELAEMLEVEKATAGRMVDRMEKKGWVVRQADAGDRRVNRLHLTQEALLIQVRLAQIADRTVDDALALLSPRERDQFSEWMRRVKTQLQAMLEPDSAEPIERPEELAGEFTGELVP